MNTKTQKPTAETAPTPDQAPDQVKAEPTPDQATDQVKAAPTPEPAPEPTPANRPTHRITAVPAAGFCRAGRRWYREPTEVSRADFDDAQWTALAAEPQLVVVRL